MTVPLAPALSRVGNVELMHAGTWDISTGVATFTPDDLAAAVSALECPAVRRPILKLGHTDPRFDGEPAVGYIDNVSVAEGGRTLVGDYVGMPGWLGGVIASAYPDRSIEGGWDYRCQLNHTHPFVLTGVALLGVTQPGIGTLASLQDVAALYGVAAASSTSGSHFAFTVHATKEATVPNPHPLHVAASATTEDVRRAFYEDAPWAVWIEQIQIEPLQLIVVNDDDGERSRVPIVIDSARDGEDAVTFGTPIPVVVRYEDVPNEDDGEPLEQLAAKRVIYASRIESRPTAPAAASVAGSVTTPMEGSSTVADLSDATLTTLRQRLGVSDDADEATILAALTEALEERAEPATAATPLPEGVVTIDASQLATLQASARLGEQAYQRQQAESRTALVSAAISDGRIAPVRRDAWIKQLEVDPGAGDVLASLSPGLIPVTEHGHDQTVTSNGQDLSWFGEKASA